MFHFVNIGIESKLSLIDIQAALVNHLKLETETSCCSITLKDFLYFLLDYLGTFGWRAKREFFTKFNQRIKKISINVNID